MLKSLFELLEDFDRKICKLYSVMQRFPFQRFEMKRNTSKKANDCKKSLRNVSKAENF